MTLHAREDEELRIALGGPLGDGTVAVWVEATGTLVAVAADVAALLAPEPTSLSADADGSPWADWRR